MYRFVSREQMGLLAMTRSVMSKPLEHYIKRE